MVVVYAPLLNAQKKALKMQADLEVHDLQQLRCGSMRNAELAIFGLVQSTVPLAKLL